MTEPDDTTRDLIRRAHQEDPQPPVFDVADGLADLRARATLDAREGPDIQVILPEPRSLSTPPDVVLPMSAAVEVDFDDFAIVEPLVRPYARTGGRTRPTRELRLETLVSAVEGWQDRGVDIPEQRHIARLCAQRPCALAEIAASLPSYTLGVIRILVTDLTDRGVLRVHEPDDHPDGGPKPATMERILQGLRALDAEED